MSLESLESHLLIGMYFFSAAAVPSVGYKPNSVLGVLKVLINRLCIYFCFIRQTDKTMTELEIDLNQKVGEWDVIQEAGCKLKPLHGAGYTGMINLGNSCYMNSVMQLLFTIPDFQQRFVKNNFTICVNHAPFHLSNI